jgi:AcrR family transcriptional regulator
MTPRSPEQFEKIREESRQKIAHSAVELFTEKGYDTTTIQQIATHAEVSKGLIYNYFESKEDIVLYIVNGMLALFDDMMKGIDDKEHMSPSERLKNLIDAVCDELESGHEWMRWMIPLAFRKNQFGFVTDIIEMKIKSAIAHMRSLFKKLEYEEPEKEAWFLGAVFDGMHMAALALENYDVQGMREVLYSKYNVKN